MVAGTHLSLRQKIRVANPMRPVQARIPVALYDQIAEAAIEDGVSLTQIVETAIREKLDRRRIERTAAA